MGYFIRMIADDKLQHLKNNLHCIFRCDEAKYFADPIMPYKEYHFLIHQISRIREKDILSL